MTETQKLRVFLSYAHADITPIRKLYEDLSNEGFEVWFDEESLIPGQEWKSEIERALENSDVVLVCLSNNSVSKEGFVQREFKFALDKTLEMTEDGIFLIPVRLEECKVPSKLSRYHWVDLFVDNGLKRLMKALTLRLSQVAEREVGFHQTISANENILAQEQNSTITENQAQIKLGNKNIVEPELVAPPSVLKVDLIPAFKTLEIPNVVPDRVWKQTYLPLIITVIIEVLVSLEGGYGGLDSVFGWVLTLIVVILTIVTVSFIQWLILRKFFSNAWRWIALNCVYSVLIYPVCLILMLATIWILGYRGVMGDVWDTAFRLTLSIYIILSLLLWVGMSYRLTVLISKKDFRMMRFLTVKSE